VSGRRRDAAEGGAEGAPLKDGGDWFDDAGAGLGALPDDGERREAAGQSPATPAAEELAALAAMRESRGGVPGGEDPADAPARGRRSRTAAGEPAAAGAGSGGPVRQLTLAVTFLTGIPLKVEGDVTPGDLWRSMGWYPLVGLVIGAAAWGVYAGLTYVLPGLIAAILVVIALEVLTRGLHMDGVMDTADGILSGAPRERALEIMKDHNVGAMGVVAAVLLIVLKVAALGSLARPEAAAPLIAGWAAARALPALDVYLWPYARPAGTGEAFTRERSLGPVELAGAFLVAGVVVAGFAGLLLGTVGSWYAGLVAAVASMAVALGVQALVARKLGGLTGDVYGMGIELAEAAALVTACVVVGVLV
jgi:adenosylcobinamide-GDP ribazoletransferase